MSANKGLWVTLSDQVIYFCIREYMGNFRSISFVINKIQATKEASITKFHRGVGKIEKKHYFKLSKLRI